MAPLSVVCPLQISGRKNSVPNSFGGTLCPVNGGGSGECGECEKGVGDTVFPASVAVALSPADRPVSALAGSPLVAAHSGGGVGGPAGDKQCPYSPGLARVP